MATHDHSFIPSEHCKLIEACNEIPSSSTVASYKDSKGDDRKRVHRIIFWRKADAFPVLTSASVESVLRLDVDLVR
jgi:hypothetical protein